MDNKMVTLPRAAKMLGVCRMTLYTLRKQFKIKEFFRASDGLIYVLIEDLIKLKKKRGINHG